MEIFGIGPSELLLILVIALILLGPKDMQKAGRTIGRWLNNLVRSDGWKAFQQTSREIRGLPTKLMRDANMELAETEREMQKALDSATKPTASTPPRSLINSPKTENTIQPPPAKPTEADPTADEKVS